VSTAEEGAPPTLERLGGWPYVLGRLAGGHDLTPGEAQAALTDILEGNATPSQLAAFIFGLRCKRETVDEMTGLLRAMVGAAEQVPVPPGLLDRMVDTCGTGGDRSGTANISTMAAFVVSGAGAPVCKHGNRAASSKSGSADVLEALGVVIGLGPSGVARCINEAGIGFCFAPRFHPSMRHAGPTRGELGVPTVFNFLGPLANPARVRRQVVGVSDPDMADKMLRVLAANGAERILVVHGHDGLDELTTTTTSTVHELREGEVRTYVVDPHALGLPRRWPGDLQGADAMANADVARRVMGGERGAHRDIVLLNAAAGIVAAGLADGMGAGLEIATAAVDDGRAGHRLEQLVEVSRAAAD
jgi:anthranilate phosphoribosyltransferase